MPNPWEIDWDTGNPPKNEAPTQVRSAQDYATVPAGSLYRDPSGKLRRKPQVNDASKSMGS